MAALAVAVLLAVVAASAQAGASRPALSARGIGAVRFGVAKHRAVTELTRLLGRPSRRFFSDGCGPRYTEVEWGHLYAEFRLGKFSGFRYMTGAWLRRGVFPGATRSVSPKLKTARGISIGSTLGQLRARYGKLTLIGTDRWQSRDGLVFYDDSKTEPPPPSIRLIEIKYGTCGDW